MQRSVASTEQRIRALFGDPLETPPGILHVASAWRDPSGALLSLRIGPRAPRSETDRFCLALARARCDAIVTTGRILREEPGVQHALPPELVRWRRDRLGHDQPPLSVVLTARPDLDPGHPLLRGAARVLVVSSRDAAPALRARADGARAEVVARPAPSLRDTLSLLTRERGLASVCIEAGPSSSRDLYDEPIAVDELMLSVFLGPAIEDPVRGAAFVDPRQLARHFLDLHTCERLEESGPWLFRRLVRRPGLRTG